MATRVVRGRQAVLHVEAVRGELRHCDAGGEEVVPLGKSWKLELVSGSSTFCVIAFNGVAEKSAMALTGCSGTRGGSLGLALISCEKVSASAAGS
jgi:hypothetical protein